ncbi:MAG: hypothetical protein ACOVVK_06200, partial [Elsteraceae bacterium]
MSPITSLLAERAFSHGQQGRIAEAVGPLFVSALLGGDARTAEIADVVAWTLAERADAALATGAAKDAAALAGLGLAVAPNIRCLLILCLLHGDRDRRASRYFARKLIAAAARSTAPTRWAAFRYVLDAVLRPQTPVEIATIVVQDLAGRLGPPRPEDPDHAEAEAIRAALESALRDRPLSAAPVDGPGDPASQRELHRAEADYHALMGQRDLALAHGAALLALCAEDPAAASRERAEIERVIAACKGDADQPLDAVIDASLTGSADGLAALGRRLIDAGEIKAARSALALAAPRPADQTERWIEIEYLRALAEDWRTDEAAAAREARACDRMIAATDAAAASADLGDLALRRGVFLLERDQRDAALSDLGTALKRGPSLPVYGALWSLMRRLWEAGDLPRLRAAAVVTNPAPPLECLEWICVLYHQEIAARWTAEAERTAIEAAAAEAVILRTDAMLRDSPGPFQFRLQRTYFSIGHNLFKYALDDLVILFAALKGNEAL